jgi:hypothetical protein
MDMSYRRTETCPKRKNRLPEMEKERDVYVA